MKNVYMWQPNYTYGNDAYLPYSIGVLAAYAWSDEFIQTNYKLKMLGYLRKPIEEVVESVQNPDVCVFSCYIWNYEYNKALAKRLKEEYPTCQIIFGGHQLAPEAIRQMFQTGTFDMQYCDYFIYDEGEIAFRDLLKALIDGSALKDIPNISFDCKGTHVFTARQEVTNTDFPSPYLTGLFDDIMAQDTYSFSATLETNRGCPFSCAYCDWGIYKTKIRQFPMERIKAEIDWIADHKIDLVFGADSNFGIYERDEEIANYLIQKHNMCGFPKKFRVAYTKNTGERVYDINYRLNEVNMCKGATLSFQSLNEKTLENVGRKNIAIDYFTELMAKYNAAGIPTYSEVILGLPGETYQSFCEGLDKLLQCGQHSSINIYLCELLPNSFMAQQMYIDKFQIKTLKTLLNQYHCVPITKGEDVQEYSVIVTENYSLSFEDWQRCYMFAWVIQCFHCMGLVRFIAIYLHYERQISYTQFYNDFLDFLNTEKESIAGKAYHNTVKIFTDALQNSPDYPLVYVSPKFGGISWPLEEGAYLEILSVYDCFLEQITLFLQRYQIAQDVLKDLMQYQKHMMRRPNQQDMVLQMRYDFHNYFRNIFAMQYTPLRKKDCTLSIHVGQVYTDWDKFAQEVVWYGRKGGRNQYSDIEVLG